MSKTITFKIRNGIAPYVVKLQQIIISGGGYGYYGYNAYNIYDGNTVFAKKRVETNETNVQFTGVPVGNYILEVVDDTKFSTLEYITIV